MRQFFIMIAMLASVTAHAAAPGVFTYADGGAVHDFDYTYTTPSLPTADVEVTFTVLNTSGSGPWCGLSDEWCHSGGFVTDDSGKGDYSAHVVVNSCTGGANPAPGAPLGYNYVPKYCDAYQYAQWSYDFGGSGTTWWAGNAYIGAGEYDVRWYCYTNSYCVLSGGNFNHAITEDTSADQSRSGTMFCTGTTCAGTFDQQ